MRRSVGTSFAWRTTRWIVCLVVVMVGAANAPAQQLVCDAAASPGTACDNRNTGAFCTSAFGAQSNCMVTGFSGANPICDCRDIDCTGGACFDTKYGLGHPDDWKNEGFAFRDEFLAAGLPVADPRASAFKGSFTFTRGSPSIPNCSTGDQQFSVVMGTWIFRERTACDPFNTAANPNGCPVKLALDVNLDDPDHPEHLFTERRYFADFGFCDAVGNRCELFGQVASQGSGFGIGRRVPNTGTSNATCTGLDTPNACCTGAGAGTCNQDTRVIFDQSLGTPGGAASRICCNSEGIDSVDLCDILLGSNPPAGVAKYPIVGDIPNTSDAYVGFPDLLFDGDTAGFPPFGKFESDRTMTPAGQRYGVCLNNRTRGCDCGVNGANCLATALCQGGTPNNGLPCTTVANCPDDGIPQTPPPACVSNSGPTAPNPCTGLGDTCDLRDPGWRLNPADRIRTAGPDYGKPNPRVCSHTSYVWRGTPGQYCLLGTIYNPDDGDPGPDCGVLNFGAHQRPDLDCNGVPDALNARAGTNDDGDPDYCPSFSELNMGGANAAANQSADTDQDGRGDECECGDANLDGRVNVQDIVATNVSIFNPPFYPPPNLANPWPLWFHADQLSLCVAAGNPFPCCSGFKQGNCLRYEPGSFRRILTPLMDANNSVPLSTPFPNENFFWQTGGEVNVSDIVQVNLDTFNPNSARCGRSPVVGQ